MEELISMYIDDVLNLDDKIVFVETVHESKHYKDDTVELLKQEKQLRAPAWDRVPEVFFPQKPKTTFWIRRPFAVAASALAAAALVLLFCLADGAHPAARPESRPSVCGIPARCRDGRHPWHLQQLAGIAHGKSRTGGVLGDFP